MKGVLTVVEEHPHVDSCSYLRRATGWLPAASAKSLAMKKAAR
jgi:hypothetical protein